MNLLGLLLLSISLAASPSALQTPMLTVQGVVSDTRTRDPLPSVQVRLTSKSEAGTRPIVVSAFTGPDGKFRLSAPPATYTVLAQRPGFFGPPSNGVPEPSITLTITLSAGQQPADLVFMLTQAGVITGQLSDENGRPLGTATVGAFQVRYQDGRPVLTPVRTADTNELGEYRLYWVPPGDYIVAFGGNRSNVAPPTLAAGADPRAIQTRTYYPGATDIAGARMVTVTDGKESAGVNFGVRTTTTFNISGRVVNPYAPAPVPGAPEPSLLELPGFTLVNRDVVGAQEIVMSTFANALSLSDRQKGLFELRAIPPGRYDLYSTTSTPAFATTYSGRVTIDLLGQDLKDIAIPVHPPAELRGKLVAQGLSLPEKTAVKLRSTESTRVSPGVDASADATGEFVFKAVGDGTSRIEVSLPPDSFISDLKQGDRSIYGDGLIRVSGEAPVVIQVVIAANAGSVAGTVIHPDEKVGVDTTIVAVPDGPLRSNLMLYATARAEDSGQFNVNNIAPGQYKFFAFEDAMNGVWMNPDFLAKYEDRAIPASVAAGKANGLRVPVIWMK